MAWLAAVGAVAGVGLSAAGSAETGRAAEYSKALTMQRGVETRAIAEDEAGQDIAAAQRQAMNQDRMTKLVESRARAVAAAGGAGATDPTVVNLISRISGEGALRSLTALYQGEERARKLRVSGELAERYGIEQGVGYDSLASAANMKTAATVVSGVGSLFSKYGGGRKTTTTDQSGGGAGNELDT